VYQTNGYSYGDDLVGRIYVPNGTYDVRFMFAQPLGGKTITACSAAFQPWHNPVALEVQGERMLDNWDFGTQIQHTCATPVDETFTAAVTNGVLEFAVRNVAPHGYKAQTAPLLSGVEITKQ